MKRGIVMEPKDYIITKIEGEYAYLREIGRSDAEELFIALAFLPMGADLGSRLHFEMFNYTLLD